MVTKVIVVRKSVVFRGVPVQVWLRAPNYRHSVMVARQPPNLFVRVQVLVPVPFFSCKLSLNLILLIIKLNAFVAQLDRAIGFYPSGCGFDSCQRRQFLVIEGLIGSGKLSMKITRGEPVEEAM